MKRLLTILFVGFCQFALADEPPCWCEFSIKSDNGLYRADIEFDKADSLKEPWDRRWTINIFELKPDSNLNWSSEFYHDGYGGGILSNDGQVYVYINFWLDMEEPPNQVVIYTKKNIRKLSGKDLKLIADNYSHTVSHQIWIDEYELIPNYLSDSTYLKIKTEDSKEIRIDLKSGEIENSITTPQFLKENNRLKKYGIGILLFIGIGIVLIVIKNKIKA
ncbi:hypothetical protein [Fulvivirga ligni]|uniref:hypothetical protein n=1 Tax=Fulvivirga ligni TaxID=2904246 RepID=UPI001F310B85|nr:hypothetical protein [Fulvivirga ligni]UII20533.1 hypothetical protein LVD16_22085 [Fulvivirga ligni]